MAWRPYENLIDGELDNRTPGKVTGWIRFFRRGKKPLRVILDLTGDFHEDIRGRVIRLKNTAPSDRNAELGREGTYMEGFNRVQRGTASDITAGRPLGPWTEDLARKLMEQEELKWVEEGVPEPERLQRASALAAQFRHYIAAGDLYYPYVAYPYVEWYADANGRVVLELDASQVEVLDDDVARTGKTSTERPTGGRKRSSKDLADCIEEGLRKFSRENRKKGAYNSIFGAEIR